MKKLLACLIVLAMLGGVFGVAYAQTNADPGIIVDYPVPTPPQPIPD